MVAVLAEVEATAAAKATTEATAAATKTGTEPPTETATEAAAARATTRATVGCRGHRFGRVVGIVNVHLEGHPSKVAVRVKQLQTTLTELQVGH
jgi:hypothetical protein